MSTIDRASLLQEFYDTTSPRLLKQPEPPYIYARLWLDSAMASPPSVDSLGRPNDGFGLGAYASFDEQMAAVEQNVFRETFEMVQEIGKKPGHTVRLNRPAFTNSTYTLASRRIPSGSTISTTGLSVTSEQVSLTLERFGGPYDTAVQPLSIERFDSSVALHGMAKLCDMHIVRDYHRWKHYCVASLLDLASTSNNVFPGAKTATTDFAAAGDGPMSWDMVLKTARILANASIPQFSNGKWAMVLNPYQIEQLAQDPAYQRLAEFHPQFNSLFQGAYVKTAGDFVIFRTPALNTTTNGGSVTVYKGHAFGPGILGGGLGDPPRVARNNNDNYGETDLIIWLEYSAIGVLDNRFGCVIYTD